MTTSVDATSIAQQLKDVTLNAVNTVKEAVVGESASVEEKHRIFVGNLSNETTEDEIKSFFAQAGEVVSLPARRNARAKQSGIAFVNFTNDADADKAVETLNGKSLGERELSVAIARPLSENKKPRQSAKSTSAGQENGEPVSVNGTSTEATSADKKKKRSRKPKAAVGTDETTAGDGVKTNGTTSTKAHVTRAPRERGPPSDGVPSPTTLFVAGLDHKTTDAELKELFAKYQPTSAHVALRPIPRFMVKKLAEKGEQRLGRGFGFVTFADHETQQSALALNGTSSGERELTVKVAMDSPERLQKTEAAPTPAAA